jgi:hypothetical protein
LRCKARDEVEQRRRRATTSRTNLGRKFDAHWLLKADNDDVDSEHHTHGCILEMEGGEKDVEDANRMSMRLAEMLYLKRP